MKKAILATLVLVALAFAGPAQASPIYVSSGDYIHVSRTGVPTGAIGGGEYLVEPAMGSNFTPFISFCLQLGEYLESPTQVYKVQVSDYVEVDNVYPDGRDPLDYRTAKIYAYYSTDFGGRFVGPDAANAKARAVQDAIWYIENEMALNELNADALYLVQQWVGTPTGLGNVRAMNLTWINTAGQTINAQDLLAPIPEPGSMFLLGTGLVGLAKLARRRRS